MLANKALSAAPSAVPVYIEDVFSTYLYSGTSATQTITNSIDLSTKGGMVWLKNRGSTSDNGIYDTTRGANNVIYANLTNAQSTLANSLTAFGTTGFTLGTDSTYNFSADTLVSRTFREQPKFFDVVTYTGNGSARTISHNLGSTPGCIIIKCTNANGSYWIVYHRSLGNTKALYLNTTDSEVTTSAYWNNTSPTSTEFTVNTDGDVNANGQTYVAYLFAHDAGGFGLTGSDNVITCGSYTGTGAAGNAITLGYEPQWLLIKQSNSTGSWVMIDNMRGFPVGISEQWLYANLTNAESAVSAFAPTSTGFVSKGSTINTNGATYIYIAIRRGPMKTPTTGTSIFIPTAFSGNDTSGTRSAGLNAFDLLIAKRTASSSLDWVWLDKLRGLKGDLWMASNSAEDEKASGGLLDTINTINGQYTQDGINITKTSNYSYLDAGSSNYIWYALKRAPSFFDEVCYTGTGSNTTITHNLGVAPELWIVKGRDAGDETWNVGSTVLAATERLILASTAAKDTVATMWNSTYPTSTVFSIGTAGGSNTSSKKYVAYLFASLTGVSKVGSYTGNGSSQTINCGFTGGARFVLIKRTDSTGDWYVYDTARGIVSGNDSQLKLNTDATAATGFDAIDPDNSGFIVNNDATNFPINVNAATYIYLAIA
jgi:hypothetical protein